MAKIDGNIYRPQSIGIYNATTGEHTPLDAAPHVILAPATDTDALEPRVITTAQLTEVPLLIAEFTVPKDSPLARWFRRLTDWRERAAHGIARMRADRESRN